MLYYEGLSCPVCGNAFTTEDDVVACPKCGLPHHRACWKNVGHCYESDKHDTPEQWTRDRAATPAQPTPPPATSAQVCVQCGTQNSEYAEFCMRCGTALPPKEWHSAQQAPKPPVSEYTHYGQSAPYVSGERIGNNSADELAAVVGSNAGYYLDRFRRIAQGKSGGWNWAAFILGPIWLFYRKQYGLGVLYLLLQVMLDIATALAYIPVDTLNLTEEAIMALMNDPVFVVAVVFSYVILALRIILGVRANNFYFSHCQKKIADTKSAVPDTSVSELTAVGGASIGLAIVIAVLLYSVFPLLIDALVQLFTVIPA